jgi:predicted Zn-dependent protease
VAVRILLVALALLAGGWLVVQERAARAEQRLTQLVFESDAPIPADEADRLLDQARRLNPDRRPDMFEAVVRNRQGRTAEAIAALERVTGREPENIDAWGLLTTITKQHDPELARRAREQVRRLSPLRD